MFNAIKIVFLFCLTTIRSVIGLGNIFIPNANAFNSSYSSGAFAWFKSELMRGSAKRSGLVGTPIEYYYTDNDSSGYYMTQLSKESTSSNTTNVTQAQGKVIASQIVDFYYGLKDYMPTVSPDGNIARGIAAWIGKTLYLLDVGLQAFYVRLFRIMDLQSYQSDDGESLQQWFEWCQEIGLAICVIVLLFYIIGVILAYNTSGFQRMKDIMYDLLLATFFLGALPTLTNFATEGASSVAQSVLGTGYGKRNSQASNMQNLANQIMEVNVYSVIHKVVQMTPGSVIYVGHGQNIQYQPHSYLYTPDNSATTIGADKTGQTQAQGAYDVIPNKPLHSQQVIINLAGMSPTEQASWNGLTGSSRVYQFFQQYGTDADVLSGEQLSQIDSTITGENAPYTNGNSSSSGSSNGSNSKSSKGQSNKKSSKPNKKAHTILPNRLVGNVVNAINPSTHAESLRNRALDSVHTNQKVHAWCAASLWGGSCHNSGEGWHTTVGKNPKVNMGSHSNEKGFQRLCKNGHYMRAGCYHSRADTIADSVNGNNQKAPDQMNIFQYGIHSSGRTANIQKLGSFGTFRGTLPFADSYARYKVNWTDIYLGLGLLAAVLLSFIAKLVGTFFKAMVMYATAGIMIYKSIGSPSKIKYYIRTFFQLYEMLIMDVIMIKMYFIGYNTVNSACNDILFNHFPIPVNSIVLGITQAACDIALFYTTLSGVDAISRLLGQPTGSSDSWGKALMSLQLGGMALSGGMKLAGLGLNAAKGVGLAGVGLAGKVAHRASSLGNASKVASHAGGLSRGRHSNGKPRNKLHGFFHHAKNASKSATNGAGEANDKNKNDKNPYDSPNKGRKNSLTARDQQENGIASHDHANNDKSGAKNGSKGNLKSKPNVSGGIGSSDGSNKSDSNAFGGTGTPETGNSNNSGKAQSNALLHKIAQDANGGGGTDSEASGNDDSDDSSNTSTLADNPDNEIDSGSKGQQSDLDKNATASDQPMMQHHGGPAVTSHKLGSGKNAPIMFTPVHHGGNGSGVKTRRNNGTGSKYQPVTHAFQHAQNVGQGMQDFAQTANNSSVGQGTPTVGGTSISKDQANGTTTNGATTNGATSTKPNIPTTGAHVATGSHPINTSSKPNVAQHGTGMMATSTPSDKGLHVENPTQGNAFTITPSTSNPLPTGSSNNDVSGDTPVPNNNTQTDEPVSNNDAPTIPTVGQDALNGSHPINTSSKPSIAPQGTGVMATSVPSGNGFHVENPMQGDAFTITPSTQDSSPTDTTSSSIMASNHNNDATTMYQPNQDNDTSVSIPTENPHQNDGINKMREEEQQIKDQMNQSTDGTTVGNPFNGNLGTIQPKHNDKPDFRKM